MKKIINILLLMVFVTPVYSLNFDSFSKDNFEFINSIKEQNTVTELFSMSLNELSAQRPKAAKLVPVGHNKFFCTIYADADWDIHFAIWPENKPDKVAIWKDTELKDGVVYNSADAVMNIKEENGIITIECREIKCVGSVTYDEIFKELYDKSAKIVFADLVEYAVIRNVDPLSKKAGIITMRIDADGMFWYSFNFDDIIENQIKWLVGINSVLYGMKIRAENLVFFSKPIDITQKITPKERALNY